MASSGRIEASHYDTIIIGAGMSGLACAAKLLEHPIYHKKKRVLLLEARDRIGGRIGSVRINGNRLDTGANWIHGVGTKEYPNPILEFVPEKHFRELVSSVSFRPPPLHKSSAGQHIVETQTDHDWVRIDSTSPEPRREKQTKDLVIPPKVAVQIFASLWELIASLHEAAAETPSEISKRTSMLQAIVRDEGFSKAFEHLPEIYHETLKALPQFIEGMEAAPLSRQSAEHSRDNAGMGLLEFALEDFDGKQVFLHDGYISVIENLGKEVVDQGLVKLGTEVQHIRWDADPIVLSTSNGKYTAKTVVCTLPLGVLQHHSSPDLKPTDSAPLFQPALPPGTTEAINSLGFGTLDKIFSVYADAWWTKEPYFSIVKKGIAERTMPSDPKDSFKPRLEPDSFWGFTNELQGLSISPSSSPTNPIATSPGPRALSIINLHALTGFPVLSAFVSCSNARYVESLSDDAAGQIVHRALTEWLGVAPPMPDAVYVTRWAQDQYSRGSYSHMITGLSETAHRQAFQKPVSNADGGMLRFAGEHTSTNHFATVHGALLSGWREADAILESASED